VIASAKRGEGAVWVVISLGGKLVALQSPHKEKRREVSSAKQRKKRKGKHGLGQSDEGETHSAVERYEPKKSQAKREGKGNRKGKNL